MGTILENKVVALVPVRAGSTTEPEIGQDWTGKKRSYSKNSGTTILLTLFKKFIQIWWELHSSFHHRVRLRLQSQYMH